MRKLPDYHFRPVDPAYSLSLDRVILISASPDPTQLHIYDPIMQSDTTVSLRAPLTCPPEAQMIKALKQVEAGRTATFDRHVVRFI